VRDTGSDPNAQSVGQSTVDAGFRRSAVVNVLGVAGKFVLPLLYVALTRWFGPAEMGFYFLVTTLGEMTASALTVGSLDAMVVYGSRHAASAGGRMSEASLYRVIGDAFALNVGISSLLMVACAIGADPIARVIYPAGADLSAAIRWFSISLPLLAISSTATAAIKIRMRMEWDVAIMSFGRPLALFGFAWFASRAGGGLAALMVATAASHAAAALAGGAAFSVHFDPRRAIDAFVHPRLDRNLIEFSIAQSVSATARRYLSRINVAVLAAFGHPAESLASYLTAALVANGVREVEVAIGAALSPVVARHRAAGDSASLQAALGRASYAALAVILPAVVILAIFRSEVLSFVHPSYRVDSVSLLVLLAPALVSALAGLPGYFLVSIGRYRVAAANAVAVVASNLILSVALVPTLGLVGAAVAASVSATMMVAAESVELYTLEGLRPGLRGPAAAAVPGGRSRSEETVA